METTKNEQELNITNISEAETNINNLNNTSKKYVIDMKEKKDDDDKSLANEKHPHQPPFEKMVTKLLPTDRYEGPTEFDKLFQNEDKTLVFARSTFYEEFLVHTLHCFIGPILRPLYKKLCTVGGLKVNGFMKSRLPNGTTNYGFYSGELKRWYQRGLHLLIFFILINIRTSENNEYFLKTFPETSVLPFMFIYLPMLNHVIRAAIIAVKYAYLPRRIMRVRREEGVDMNVAVTDLIGLWAFVGASKEAVVSRLKLASWRAGLTGDETLTFVDNISPDLWKKLDLPEFDLEVDEKANKDLRKSKYSEEYFANQLVQIENEKTRLEKTYIPTNKIPLYVILKYIAFNQTRSELTSGTMAQYLAVQFLLPLVPLAYLGIYHEIVFTERSIVSYVLEVYALLIGMNELSKFSLFFFAFPLLPPIIFDRYRKRLNMIFEMLIPTRIVDARSYDIDTTTSTNILKQLPPLAPTSKNILTWNDGRRAIQKFGIYYRKRSEVFMGFYVIVLVGLSFQQVITLVFGASDQNKVIINSGEISNQNKVLNASSTSSQTNNIILNGSSTSSSGDQNNNVASTGRVVYSISVVDEGTIIIAILAIIFTYTILKMIMSGILMNRQRKLLVSSLKSYLVRVKKDSIRQIEKIQSEDKVPGTTVPEKEIKQIQKEASEYHKAIKLVDGEMEAEETTEKARILGFAVDITMLEMIIAIFSTTAYTLYDITTSTR